MTPPQVPQYQDWDTDMLRTYILSKIYFENPQVEGKIMRLRVRETGAILFFIGDPHNQKDLAGIAHQIWWAIYRVEKGITHNGSL